MTSLARHQDATNTTRTYGWVERAFHWSIALLIPTAIVLGVVAYDMPFDTDAALARKAMLFSAHKTVGIAIFFIALARILWALSQPRPVPLHPDRRLETTLAALVHWLLYGSLLLVPLLGWAHHATAEGFAPIWWPFGQGLPFLPKDPELSAQLATLHMVFERVMVIALALHILGAIKHAVIDKDATLGRMWRGTVPDTIGDDTTSKALPVAVAAAVWAVALGVGLALGPKAGQVAASVPAEAATVDGASNWVVEDGTLSISVTQLGSAVTGTFGDWQAAIDFDAAERNDGTYGTVEVGVSTGSLTLGSVSQQATGPEFLAASSFPQADFSAIIRAEGDGYVADGSDRKSVV